MANNPLPLETPANAQAVKDALDIQVADVTGLGTAATQNTGAFATAAQGTKADAALARTGGIMTGNIQMNTNDITNVGTLQAINQIETPIIVGAGGAINVPNDTGTFALAANSDGGILSTDIADLSPPLTGRTTLQLDLAPPDGVITRGELLSINADPTKFNVAAGSGFLNGTRISWNAQNAITTTNLATATRSYISVSAAGAIVQSVDAPTPASRRANLYLGQLGHTDLTTISTALTNPDSAVNTNQSFNDFLRCLGPIPCDGNALSANGANLSINIDAGYLLAAGGNHEAASGTTAIEKFFTALTAPTFRRRTSTGNGTSSSLIDVANYDVGGTITAITGTRASNHRVYRLLSGNIVVQYGTATYTSIAEAINGFDSESFTPFGNITEIGCLIGVIAAKANATALNNPAQAQFFVPTGLGRTSSAAPLNSDNLAAIINGASEKATLVDADEFPITDSESLFALAKASALKIYNYVKAKTDTLYVALTGNQTIAGNKTFSGQTELTGQAATNSTSAMTRLLGDLRYANLPDVIIDGDQRTTDGVSFVWTGTNTGSGSTLQASNFLQVRTGSTTGSTSQFCAAPTSSLVFGKDGSGGLGWNFDSKWIVTFRCDVASAAADTDGYLTLGESISSTSTAQPTTKSCGFRFHNNGVYGFVHNGSTYTESVSSIFTPSGTNITDKYAIHNDDTNINFYVNGTLLDSITAPTGSTGNNFQGIAFWANNETTTNDMYIRIVGGIKFSNIP